LSAFSGAPRDAIVWLTFGRGLVFVFEGDYTFFFVDQKFDFELGRFVFVVEPCLQPGPDRDVGGSA
tara:strand:- start:1160 stop:1357 length:198 start_codon:yes stop_codon:yes gene_type:complete